jgi:hypothetical protein
MVNGVFKAVCLSVNRVIEVRRGCCAPPTLQAPEQAAAALDRSRRPNPLLRALTGGALWPRLR